MRDIQFYFSGYPHYPPPAEGFTAVGKLKVEGGYKLLRKKAASLSPAGGGRVYRFQGAVNRIHPHSLSHPQLSFGPRPRGILDSENF